MSKPQWQPAQALAAQHHPRYPGETLAYREARNALLAEEIELRRQIERVAALRRTLPTSGDVPQHYRFDSADGPVTLQQMFGEHDTLVIYHWMFGPQRERPCPMCTCLLSALNGEMPDILQRVAFGVVARAPIERMQAFAKERGWHHLRLYSAGGSSFNQDYIGEDPNGDDTPGLNVFVRIGDSIKHFYGDEMGPDTADPGQDPRGAPDLMPLWNILDLTPGGRGTDWYPQLDYTADGGHCH
ncbi:putative dithiol-disulfide oxidoreductase (DUF899 family) [Silvimonas terrae]|uniref:Putative dithiol-disulfide oxidoreductase (DUF899 family) n=1 Tax=Silvimonas terrae TaxID=300266 RepID=A0A840RMC5_9NEIS|nr:DUF899 family protein [Silvimonas terrae]MBB5193251.1 putative dithiol-disulfide oxidoreductase (DUF899 family) [Silvimonas terrae]